MMRLEVFKLISKTVTVIPFLFQINNHKVIIQMYIILRNTIYQFHAICKHIHFCFRFHVYCDYSQTDYV